MRLNSTDYLVTVICDIYFDNFVMKSCIFKLHLYNSEYERFKHFTGIWKCYCDGKTEYVNFNRMSRLTWLHDDYKEVYEEWEYRHL